MSRRLKNDNGYSLVELAMVLFVIGVLVAMAVPTYISASAESRRSTCFENQRTVEAAAQTWLTLDGSGEGSVLEGPVTVGHPLVTADYLKVPPTCPSAPEAADPLHPTPAEGAYVLGARGNVEPCSFGSLTAHGRYR